MEDGAMNRVLPILTILLAILAFWYAAAIWMNAPWQNILNGRVNLENVPFLEFAQQTWAQEKPVLPAPHQVAGEIWNATVGLEITSRRSLALHAWITLSATLLGFVFGTALGVVLAVVIIHNDAADRSLMPWIIASQTIPILAIAPMGGGGGGGGGSDRARAQGADLDVSQFLPRGRGDGEGPALARKHPARPHAHL
jgi:NitT/TauT family transport system permease protein